MFSLFSFYDSAGDVKKYFLECSYLVLLQPPSEELESSCPRNTRSCCYASRSELSSVDSFCRAYPGQTNEIWRQPCNEGRYVTNGPYTGNQCGERFPRDVATEGGTVRNHFDAPDKLK